MSDSALLTLIGPTTGPLADALAARANIVAATQAAEDAVLIPKEIGAWSHDLRHALAARIAQLHGETEAAARYGILVNNPVLAPIKDPANDGAVEDLAVVCAFMDKVSAQTRDVVASDIKGLQDAGIADADIVRLCELSAFMSYQLRVLAGIRLMGATA